MTSASGFVSTSDWNLICDYRRVCEVEASDVNDTFLMNDSNNKQTTLVIDVRETKDFSNRNKSKTETNVITFSYSAWRRYLDRSLKNHKEYTVFRIVTIYT